MAGSLVLAAALALGAAAQETAVEQLKASPDARSEPAPAAHGHALHGRAAPADAADCEKAGGFSDSVGLEQQKLIAALVAGRGHRVQHALWHATRSGLSDKESSDVVAAFGASWTQGHPFCPPPKADAAAGGYNPVGEDFLYMHRQMIGGVRSALLAGRQKCVAGWKGIPDPAQWPLPDGDASGAKSPGALAQLKAWDKKLEDPAWLASVSLSQLGMAAELTTHNNLHMRYATTKPPRGFSGVEETGGAPLPYDGKFPADWPYDDPKYDWLADPYGAAVNPIFWKIHGYVDRLVDLWLAAHGYDKISESCGGAARCYQWKGTWAGTLPTWSEAPASDGQRAGKQPGGKPAVDPRTKRFNQERMRRQWLGVIGGAPSGRDGHGPPRAGNPRASDDPFEYAAEQACGGR